MEKRFDTILSVAAVIFVIIVMLTSPAIASGEPSMEAIIMLVKCDCQRALCQ